MRNKNYSCFIKLALPLCSFLHALPTHNLGYFYPLSPYMIFEMALFNFKIHSDPAFNIEPSTPSINVALSNIFTSDIATQLDSLSILFSQSTNLSFYTDGSLSNLGSSSSHMGITWLQVDPSEPLHSFNTSITLPQPSSSLSELIAVLAAVHV